MPEKLDLRVIKTRRSIETAFITLLGRKQFEQITVQNILDEALVNRKTFYKHYEDKYNLADILIEREDARLEEALRKRFNRTRSPKDVPDALRDFYLTLFEGREEILALMKVRTAHHNLSEDFRQILRTAYLDRFSPERTGVDPRELDFLAESYAALAFAGIRWALESGDLTSIDVIYDVSYNHANAPGTLFVSYATAWH